MDTLKTFHAAQALQVSWYGVDLLPSALARATALTLPVDAVGLSLFSDQQCVPIASSSPQAAAAERWQFTLGDGPGYTAHRSGEPVVADEEQMRRRWPALQDQLHHDTLVRSVLALPLGLGSECIGVLELYAFTPQLAKDLDLAAAQVVACSIYASLLQSGRGDRADGELQSMPASDLEAAVAGADFAWADPAWADPSGPAWLETAWVQRRLNVWIAVGMFAAALDLGCGDALAVLRAHAYASGRTCDDLAEDLIAGQMGVGELVEK